MSFFNYTKHDFWHSIHIFQRFTMIFMSIVYTKYPSIYIWERFRSIIHPLGWKRRLGKVECGTCICLVHGYVQTHCGFRDLFQKIWTGVMVLLVGLAFFDCLWGRLAWFFFLYASFNSFLLAVAVCVCRCWLILLSRCWSICAISFCCSAAVAIRVGLYRVRQDRSPPTLQGVQCT